MAEERGTMISAVLLKSEKQALGTQMGGSRIIDRMRAIIWRQDLSHDVPHSLEGRVQTAHEQGEEVAIREIDASQQTEKEVMIPGCKIRGNGVCVKLTWKRRRCRMFQ
jgi:hypothetical protein